MNIEIKSTGKIHSVKYEYHEGVWTECYIGLLKGEYEETAKSPTCKICIKITTKKPR